MRLTGRRALQGVASLVFAVLGGVVALAVWSHCAVARFRAQVLATITAPEDVALLREFRYPEPYIMEKHRRSGIREPTALEAAMPGFDHKRELPGGVVAYHFAVTPWATGDIYFYLDDASEVVRIDEFCPSWWIVEPHDE